MAVVDMAWRDIPALVIGVFLKYGCFKVGVTKAGRFIHKTTTAVLRRVRKTRERMSPAGATRGKRENRNGRSDAYGRVQRPDRVGEEVNVFGVYSSLLPSGHECSNIDKSLKYGNFSTSFLRSG